MKTSAENKYTLIKTIFMNTQIGVLCKELNATQLDSKKMIKLNQFIIVLCLILGACSPAMNEKSMEIWKQEILEAERSFAEMAQKEGISEAFLAYAAEDAVLMRNDKLTIGKEALKASFEKNKSATGKVSLTWKPDFVDVSLSGDLGYTYGKYVYTSTDTLDQTKVFEGIFHTVWKRQADGTWKFVWD
jgi:ketosteroid isomerase-like protein